MAINTGVSEICPGEQGEADGGRAHADVRGLQINPLSTLRTRIEEAQFIGQDLQDLQDIRNKEKSARYQDRFKDHGEP